MSTIYACCNAEKIQSAPLWEHAPIEGAVLVHGALQPSPGSGAKLDYDLDLSPFPVRNAAMANPKILDEIGSKVSELLANSPAKDLEKNARALLASGFSRLDLVTREEFDLQKETLARYRDKLTELEHRVAQLESELASRPPAEAG